MPDLFGEIASRATISPCGTYRYELVRGWDGTKPHMGWIMLNPSTADAEHDDPTIRRCIAFAKSWGYGSLVVRNLYALRAINPKALKDHPDPVGPENRQHLSRCRADALTVCAWGANAEPVAVQATVGDLIASGVQLYHLGLTKFGEPRHPLYLRADTQPIRWEVSNA